MAKFSLKNSIASSRTDENGMQWYETAEYTDVKEYIKNHIMKIKENYLAIGYWLKYVNERKDYEKDGFSSIWEFAEVNYKISDSTAFRLMQINTEFSVNGNSPELDDKYKGFSKSQLQELLYISAEQREEITPDMTVKQIREIRKADTNMPTTDNVKKFFETAINRYDDTFDSTRFKEFLINEYGKSYSGGNWCGCNIKCTTRGITLGDADEITWAQLLKLINELLASRELVLPSDDKDVKNDVTEDIKVESKETHFDDTEIQIPGQMEIEDYPEVLPEQENLEVTKESNENVLLASVELQNLDEVNVIKNKEVDEDHIVDGEYREIAVPDAINPNYEFEKAFSSSVMFEFSVAIQGWSYLIIFGKHVNGYFCCVPNWKWGCEMAAPYEVGYNKDKLIESGASESVAGGIAEAIRDYAEKGKLKEV